MNVFSVITGIAVVGALSVTSFGRTIQVGGSQGPAVTVEVPEAPVNQVAVTPANETPNALTGQATIAPPENVSPAPTVKDMPETQKIAEPIHQGYQGPN